jgi:hypothetical protein
MTENKITNLSEFKKKNSEFVYTCECGSQLFFLHFAEPNLCGEVECRLCGKIPMSKCWGDRDEII